MANISDISRDRWMLTGPLAKKGYDWWWHSFTAENEKTGEKKPFYVEFFTCNPAWDRGEPSIVWNLPEEERKGKHPSYVMVNAGFWGEEKGQLHRFFSWKDVEIRTGVPFEISAGDCYCSETFTKGSVAVDSGEAEVHPEWMSDRGEMSWELNIDKKAAFHVGYGASALFRKLNAFQMFWHAEGIRTEYTGWVLLNGERYLVRPETCYGYADKNWGSDFTSPWVWLSSCHLKSTVTGKELKNSVFEIGGGRPKIYFLPLKGKLLGTMQYEGREYEFNFSKFWTGSRTSFSCEETEKEILWHVVQRTRHARLETEVRCSKKEMLHINYEAPDGTKKHNRLWNGGNGVGVLRLYEVRRGKDTLVDEIYARNIGCEYGEYAR